MEGPCPGGGSVSRAIYSLLMMKHGFVTPSINIEELDEKADGMNIIQKPTEAPLRTVMSNSFGFGGTNASLVMRQYSE